MDARQLATVLAALRWWQHYKETGGRSISAEGMAYIRAIANDGGTIQPLTAGEIAILCQELNTKKGEL